MLSSLYPVRDLRLSGQVIHVGRSSMEIVVRMEAINQDGTDKTVMLGVFCEPITPIYHILFLNRTFLYGLSR